MAGVQVHVDDTEVRAALERLHRFAESPAAAMKDAGEYMQRAVDDRFNAQQSPDGQAWAPNTPVTLLRKKNPRILHERAGSGLRGSIHYRASDTEMRQGTDRVYAAVHQFGAEQGAFGTTSRGAPIPWGDIPARPYLGFSADDSAEILQIMEDHIQQRWSQR
ncbi:phage virion morphogenesis protein [Arhodomonas aquaeolei]|uniref:phage virion morphogenesis protein n=1 Tax=Arhodomonas aquaeolei TaxID=2369 RepID=UPI00216770D8|nr:phage virion morphogenesis protein [Arhodomonas aquaeolei]MCS4503887.1 phage virion morphogenesis protein [Arhodomonas aquaeolei]